ncbi:MAG: hypothetical protein WAO61_09620 [Solirubrobacterales bacterium]
MFAKLRGSEFLTMIGAIVLFIATFFEWWEVPVPTDELGAVAADALRLDSSLLTGLNVWDLSIGRWFVYLALIAAAAMVLAAAFGDTPEWAVQLATPTIVFGFAATLVLAIRVLDAPADRAEPTTALYLAVAGSLALLCGGCWAIRDEMLPSAYAQAPEPEVVHLDSAP